MSKFIDTLIGMSLKQVGRVGIVKFRARFRDSRRIYGVVKQLWILR